MSIARETAVVILAAGRGTRMGEPGLAKVCLEIDGRPAIVRLIETFRAQGFGRFVVVVGHAAEQVRRVIGEHGAGVTYVTQQPQLGTGHAAKVAAEALERSGHDGYVLVTMGDKLIEPGAIEVLVEGFVEQAADMALLMIPKSEGTQGSGGRVLVDDAGRVVGIVEQMDLARQAIAEQLGAKLSSSGELTGSAVRRIIDRHISEPAKQAVTVGRLLELAQKGRIDSAELASVLQAREYNLTVGGRRYSAEQVERGCAGINPSLYLFRAAVFYRGVGLIDNDNAQAEYYLTDIVEKLAALPDAAGPRFKITVVPVRNADWIQGFNSPDELLAIEDYLRRSRGGRARRCFGPGPRLEPSRYCPVSRWVEKIEKDTPALRRWLAAIYGRHPELHQRKRRTLVKVLECYGQRFGFEQEVCIVRAPGRINLMGRHVDHRGGWNNCLAIDRETIVVAGPREDDRVEAVNLEPRTFGPVTFAVSELMGRFEWTEWANFIDSQWVRQMLRSTAGDWGNYIKAAMLRLQHHYRDTRIRGMNLALAGDVPIAAGLSSSSTIVVASLQAAIALNGLELTASQFVDLCGQGEWFVGSRGGAGDHAAIRLGQRGKIAHIGYLPFRVEKMIDAPKDYQVVIAQSHIKAAKSAAAKDTFNARIAAYNLGFALLRQRCPDVAARLGCLRDLEPHNLGCTTAEVYRMLLKVPVSMTREEFAVALSSHCRDMLEANLSSHRDPGSYPVRPVLLFGVSEIARSRICAAQLERGLVEEFGKLMRISHDGDRVSRPGKRGRYVAFEQPCDDVYIGRLIADAGSAEPGRASRAELANQPGGYACSTPEIDRMVDIACSVPGVAGAQIAGAGLGGCIVALAEKGSVERLGSALTEGYYEPAQLEPAVIPCITTEGACLADF